jgi:two-component system chemotaxis sensor kinase CheA
MTPSEYGDEELIREFLSEAEEHFNTLDADLLQIENVVRAGSAPPIELVEAMFRAVHTVKGLAAMFDYNAMKDLAHSVEHILDGLRKGTVPFDTPCLETLFDGADALKAVLTAVHTPDQGAADARTATARISAFLKSDRDSSATGTTQTPEHELSEYARMRIAEAVEEGLRPIRISLRWGIELRLGSLQLASLERALGRGEILDVRPLTEDVPALDAIDSHTTDLTVEVFALTDLSDDEISNALGVVTSAIIGLQPAAVAEEEDVAEVETEERMAGFSEHVIRVDIARLDDLMDLTGEIVTARTRLDDLVDTLKARDIKDPLTQAFTQSAKDMGVLIDLLQEHVMSLRMVPVRQLFSKFPRTVRDLARRSDKEIRLVYEGEDTEFDKRLIEQIEDSILHMVRNACDHGIETPDVREAAGKPRTGTVTLAAGHEGNHIIIEVRDDGRGLDVLAIWEKAVEAGLISSEQELDDGLLADLIMTSGFSTAREITDISGRGVGMDVVRKKTAELGGSIRLSSELGTGTTIYIRLPMTLAILPSLLVVEAGRAFAVPIASVSEVLRVSGKDVRRLRGTAVMDLRGEALPVARLGDVLGISDGKWARDRKGFVIVVAAAGHRLGVAVDALEGQQQVVVKNLEEAVGRTAGISGATILGDGTVVPIIDVDGVVTLVADRVSARASTGGERK